MRPTPRHELTQFRLRAGLAFGTFRQYVYEPFVTKGLHSRAERIKAGRAAHAVIDEVLAAKHEASGGTAVRQLFAPLAALADTLGQTASKLEHGQLNGADLRTDNGSIDAIEKSASADGIVLVERPPTTAP